MAECQEGIERDADGCQKPIQASDDVETDHNEAISGGLNGLSIDTPTWCSTRHPEASDRMAISNSIKDIGTGTLYHWPTTLDETPAAGDIGAGDIQPDSPSEPAPPPYYPEYRDEEARRQTFMISPGNRTWPHSADVQDIGTLVRHGLFYTGIADLGRCYQCGLGLKDWTRDDDVLFVHLKYAPNCYHIKHNTDRNLIAIYRRQIEESNAIENGVPRITASVNEVRHPEYQSYQVRVSSFTHWPQGLIQTPEQLAEAGFFFTGVRDVVRCFACDTGLQSWEAGDQPWLEHARWSPNCKHVLEVKGADFVQLVQQAVEHQRRNEPDIEENTFTNAEMVYPLYSKPAKDVIALGYSKAAVAMAIDECKSKNLGIRTETLLNVLLDKQERGETLPEDPPRAESPQEPQFDNLTKEGLLAERAYLKSRMLCNKCKERECNILFLPCGHHKFCEQCAKGVTECPLCSAKILNIVKTYLG